MRLTHAVVVDARGVRHEDVCIEEGRFVQPGPARPGEETLDCAGRTLMPALVDMHTHLRSPGQPEKETMQTGMRAALAGGYGTLCAMANTLPVCETPARVRANLEKAGKLRLCRLVQAAAAGVNLGCAVPTDWAGLSRVTPVLSNDGNNIASERFMRALLRASERYGFRVSTHCQPEAETVARDIGLVREVGGHLHVGHVSLASSLALIRKAKAEGLRITCEVMPHHLFGWDCDYRVYPPFRTRADVEALIEGVRDGTIDCLASDHAPHTPQDKAHGMPGISMIDHALSIFLQVFYENGIPLSRLSEMASNNPARLLGVGTGLIEPGRPADLVCFDPDAQYRIDPDAMRSRSHNTPFGGRAVRGKVYWTMIGGDIRYDHGQTL